MSGPVLGAKNIARTVPDLRELMTVQCKTHKWPAVAMP